MKNRGGVNNKNVLGRSVQLCASVCVCVCVCVFISVVVRFFQYKWKAHRFLWITSTFISHAFYTNAFLYSTFFYLASTAFVRVFLIAINLPKELVSKTCDR